MNTHWSRIRTYATGALAFVLAGAAGARADSKRAAPLPNPDVIALKNSISALTTGPLHDLSEGQAATNARIDSLEAALARATRQLEAVDLAQAGRDAAATRGAVAGILADDAGIENQLTGVDARVQAAAEQAAGARQDWTHQMAAEDDRWARFQQEQRAWEENFEREAAAGASAAGAAEDGRAALARRSVWSAAAVLAALLAVGWIVQARLRRRTTREVLLTLSRLGADLRQNSPRHGGAPSALEWEGLEHRLRALTDRWETLAAQLPTPTGAASAGHITEGGPRGWNGAGHLNGSAKSPAPRTGAPVSAVLARDGHVNGGPGAMPSGEKPTVSVGALPEPSVASRHLWPAQFMDPESPLSRWRFLLESHLDGPHPALPVLGGMLGLRALLARPGAIPSEIAAAAFRLSESLYAYWQSLTELSTDDCQQASAAWLEIIRSLIAPLAPRLELREVLPSARIDLDLMHPVREGPGNHLNVADVFSWAVLDRSLGDRPKVLHRALVASS
ncbi:MAG TPA: hypothetical protein VFE31_07470 [Opitutaceae bacterium]|nr:hypothetical protein [Opitutaceae bacterium]